MSARRSQSLARVLVAEDEALVAMHLSEVLRASGYDVVGPFAGASEIDDKDLDQCDLALLDLRLLQSSGLDIAKRIPPHKSTSIAIMSAYSDDETIGHVMTTAPPAAYLLKPLDEGTLLSVLAILQHGWRLALEQVQEILAAGAISVAPALLNLDVWAPQKTVCDRRKSAMSGLVPVTRHELEQLSSLLMT